MSKRKSKNTKQPFKLEGEIGRIHIGDENISEELLDKNFINIFKLYCSRGIPVWGFLNDSGGQWMFGPMECFQEVFKDKYVVFKFDLENYIDSTPGPFWVGELDPYIPMNSRLLKWTK